MMTTIAEHTVDLSLLPKQANILDIGCRGFLFADDLRRLGHNVVCVDVDVLGTNRNYFICAIAGYTGKCAVQRSKDPQATRMTAGVDVPCYTLPDFSKMVKVDFWDVVKVDVEGAEYEILMSLTEAPAKQISVEMHLHTGIYGMDQVKEMEAKLYSLGYYAAKHELTKQHGLGFNFWDSLFILKD